MINEEIISQFRTTSGTTTKPPKKSKQYFVLKLGASHLNLSTLQQVIKRRKGLHNRPGDVGCSGLWRHCSEKRQ
jgi:hypothetical protein